MSATVSYKGSTLTTATNQTRTLETAGKYLEDDITIVDVTTAINNQNKTVSPTESQQSVSADSGYTGLGTVTVNAIPSNYVGTGITRRTSTDLTVSGATVTAPSGYYSASASKSVASGTAGTPTATKGTVSNHSVSVTPSVTNTTGYITGGTKTGTAVTVSASELVSGSQTIQQNGTVNVTNLASVVVDVQSGADVPIFTIDDDLGTVTCNKTYNECFSLYNRGCMSAIATNPTHDFSIPLIAIEELNPTSHMLYIHFGGGDYSFDISYTSNNLAYNEPSSKVNTLTVTENGTYSAPYNSYYDPIVVNVQGGGSSSVQVGTATVTPSSASSSITFTGLSGNPTSFVVTSSSDIATNTSGVTAVVFDGTSLHGQKMTTQVEADTGFTKSYSGGSLTITASSASFQANAYKLVYTYGGSTSDIHTADVQVGSGATSITFSVSGRPVYWSCIFKSNFSTSSGYQRVIAVANDSSSTYGLAMDSAAHYATSWTSSYSGGNFTINSQSTNNGGYFHQPGYYQLTYYVDDSAPQYQSKTVTPTTSQQIVTPDSGYDALEQVTVNAIPSSYVQPTSTIGATTYRASTSNQTITSGTYHSAAATIAAVSATNLEAGNIKSGTTISISNGQSNLWSVTGTYTGGGGGSVSVATTTWNNSSNTTTSHQFTGLSGTPKFAVLRCTSQLTRSSSNTYYYIADIVWDGTNAYGNYHLRSNGSFNNVASNATTKFTVTTGTNSITFTSGGSRSGAPGSFYNGTYELVYIY